SGIELGADAVRMAAALAEFHATIIDPWLAASQVPVLGGIGEAQVVWVGQATGEEQLPAVGEARHTVAQHLRESGWGNADLIHDVELMVSELVANTLKHSEGPVRVVVQRLGHPEALLVQVLDTTPEHPAPVDTGPLPDELLAEREAAEQEETAPAD